MLFQRARWLYRASLALFVLTGIVPVSGSAEIPEKMVSIPSGEYLPLYVDSDADPKTKKADPAPLTRPPEKVKVSGFLIDAFPVTNSDFLSFVRENRKWRRSQVSRQLAEPGYLKTWKGDLDPGTDSANRPAVNVSWFAARAYCKWKKKRLPSVDEWEYVASDDTSGKDQAILDWYSKPTPEKISSVGSTFKNSRGVWDLHGLIWEWTSDFNSAMVTGESRGDSSLERNLYCGASSVGSTNPRNYAAFMRYGFRSSLKGNYTIANLGFRCAKAVEEDGRPVPTLDQLESQWVDQAGRKALLSSLKGKVRVVALIYTSCQYACPLMVKELQRLDRAVPETLKSELGFALFTMDPKVDNPDRLREYARANKIDLARWSLFTTEDPENVRELSALLGARYKKIRSGGYSHSNLITVFDRAGGIRYQQEGLNQNSGETVQAILRTIAERPN